MIQSEFTYEYELNEFRGEMYHIGVRTDPSPNNVESFAAILFFQKRDGTRVEVAKVDDSPHEEGDIHADCYYRDIGAEIKDFDTPISDVWEAEEYLENNWRRFARLYGDNHGTEVRADNANA